MLQSQRGANLSADAEKEKEKENEMILCARCYAFGFCDAIRVELTGDEELSRPLFIYDLRNFACDLNVSFHHWHDYICNLYRDMDGNIFDQNRPRQFVSLDMDVFEFESVHFWFRDFCCTRPISETRCRVRVEARERVRVLSTILRGAYPEAAFGWGLRAANDNEPTHANDRGNA